MTLNCSKVIDEFNNLYSGICLYKKKALSQLLADNGSIIPEIKSHLVIDKPESVSLVMPPITIITPTRNVMKNNQ